MTELRCCVCGSTGDPEGGFCEFCPDFSPEPDAPTPLNVLMMRAQKTQADRLGTRDADVRYGS